MTQHSPLGPSAAHRWMRCPGSVLLCAAAPAPLASPYAEEGTVAHSFLAYQMVQVLRERGDVTVRASIDGEEPKAPEDVAAVAAACEHLLSHVEPGDEIFIEQQVSMREVDQRLYGTADFILYRPSPAMLMVCDYKHGAGVFVDVHENEQLLYYLLAARNDLLCGRVVQSMHVGIVQPRCGAGTVARWIEVEHPDLWEFELKLRAAVALVDKRDAPLKPGEKQCRFCPAVVTCPAMLEAAQQAAIADFSVPSSNDELAELLGMVPALEKWCAEVRRRAFAIAEMGGHVPGYKLVEKRANREWRNPDDALSALLGAGVPECDALTAPALKSPAQVEKILGKGRFSVLDDALSLVERRSGGLTLVADDDPRPSAEIVAPVNQ